MMRRLLPLLLMCLLLCGCTAHDPIAPMASIGDELAIPAPDGSAAIPREDTVTLWFRLGTEPLLAPETRTLSLSPTASFELTLLQALTGGPAAASTELTGVFPPGTRVTAAHRQGRTLFVTLSRQIMNDFADEPKDWAARADWAEEVPLRRLLGMQAIAATVTENCAVDEVVILVEQSQPGSDSLRLRQRYYRTISDETALAAPLRRDESLLLTPHNTARVILSCWQSRNWARLYQFVARTDPADGTARPGYDAFAQQMSALPHLTGFTISPGSVSADGQRAVLAAEVALLDEGDAATAAWTLQLHRERGLWRIGLSELTGREALLP